MQWLIIACRLWVFFGLDVPRTGTRGFTDFTIHYHESTRPNPNPNPNPSSWARSNQLPRSDGHATPSSRARTAIASATETLASAGTRAGCPYTASIAATNRESKHRRHRTSCVDRPGRTKAVIAMRSSPFLTRRLHARQHARLDGAIETLYVLGRCLNVMLYAPPPRSASRKPILATDRQLEVGDRPY